MDDCGLIVFVGTDNTRDRLAGCGAAVPEKVDRSDLEVTVGEALLVVDLDVEVLAVVNHGGQDHVAQPLC